jgi:hypothetical protein
MSAGMLELRPDATRAPVWAIVGHIAGVRVYWLCDVIGEPGAETTPFADPGGLGWEDHEDKPRDASGLVNALETTWRIVERCLDRWSPEILGETFERIHGGKRQAHSRTSILQRLFSHDAYTAASCRRPWGSPAPLKWTSGARTVWCASPGSSDRPSRRALLGSTSSRNPVAPALS